MTAKQPKSTPPAFTEAALTRLVTKLESHPSPEAQAVVHELKAAPAGTEAAALPPGGRLGGLLGSPLGQALLALLAKLLADPVKPPATATK